MDDGPAWPVAESQVSIDETFAPCKRVVNNSAQPSPVKKERAMEHRTPVKHKSKADRLEAIEIADERTEKTKTELERNIGAETPGDPGSSGSPHGDGNSVNSDRDGQPGADLNTDI
jgi:hypothetical protein